MTTDLSALMGVLVFLGGAFLLSLAVSLLIGVLGGWVVMLALGDLEHVSSSVPAIGYLPSFLGMWAISFIGMALRGGLSTNTSTGKDRQ